MKILKKLAKENNRDFALRVIKANIINLELKPGSMISEQDIANELNLSRTPVHEALQELASTKIIQILPQRGSYVSLIDLALVDEAIFLRSTIEIAVAELACEKATLQDFGSMEENLNLQEFFLSKQNIQKLFDLDDSFHKNLYKITNKMQCYDMIKLMNIHLDRIRELHLQSTNPTTVVEEHKNIFTALKNKDKSSVKELLNIHLTKLYSQENEIKKKFADYFEQK